MHSPRLSLLAALSLIAATLVLMVSAMAWLGPRGWLWSRGKVTHRLLITPTSVVYAKGDPWPAGAPPRRTLRNYGFVATHTDRLIYRDEVHTYLYSPGVDATRASRATRIVERMTLISLRNIFVMLLVLPLTYAVTWYRHRRHEQLKLNGVGKCLKCAYDLRATTGTCPECGTAPPTASPLPRITTWLTPDRSATPPVAPISNR